MRFGGWGWRFLAVLVVLGLSGCERSKPRRPEWARMRFLVGEWGCRDMYETPHGVVQVPLIVRVTQPLDGRWLGIRREEPAWSDAPTNYLEDEYMGWDRPGGRWLTISASTEGTKGYLTSGGWVGDTMEWSLHTYAGWGLSRSGAEVWKRLNDDEWVVEFHAGASAGGVRLVSQHCYKRGRNPIE